MVTASLPSSLTLIPSKVQALADPNVLYASALGYLSTNSVITASLSPLGQEVFATAAKVVENLVGEEAGQLATVLLNDIEAVVGAETLQAVEGVVAGVISEVSGAIPILGQIASFVMSFIGAVEADKAAEKQAGEIQCSSVLSRFVIGSGYSGEVLPADIFAPDPTIAAQYRALLEDPNTAHSSDADVWGYQGMPNSALGIALAAITEDGGPGASTTGNGFIWDDNIHHADEILADALPNKYKTYAPNEASVGIPKERRNAYKLLRLAMGAHNTDGGKALWAIYLDMLSADWDVTMTGGYAGYMLSHFWNSGTQEIVESAAEYGWCANNPQVVCCSQVEWSPIVDQIVQIVAQWRISRSMTSSQIVKKQTTAGISVYKIAAAMGVEAMNYTLISSAARMAVAMPAYQSQIDNGKVYSISLAKKSSGFMKLNLGSPESIAQIVLKTAKDPAVIAYWTKVLHGKISS